MNCDHSLEASVPDTLSPDLLAKMPSTTQKVRYPLGLG